jgi:hypothetical protein
MKLKALCSAALLGLFVGPALAASVPLIVYISPECQDFEMPGGTTTVDIVADIPEDLAIIGFGVDLMIDNPIVTPVDVTIPAPFDTVFVPDGDGLAGIIEPPDPIWGTGVVLATVEVSLDAEGIAWLTPGYTVDDLFEGFQTPDGPVTEIEWVPGCIIIPEPATLALLMLGTLLRRR